MYKEISQLIMYGNLDNSSILSSMADIFNRFDNKLSSKEELVTDIYTQVKRILEVATDYGFDKNLWQNYLTYFLITIIRWYIHLFYLCNFANDFFYFPAVFICNFHTHCLF